MHIQRNTIQQLLVSLLIAVLLLTVLPSMPVQSLTYPQLIIQSGAERYYRLDETSGTAIIDSAAGINGTYSNVTLNQAGAIYDGNAAVEFSGATTGGNMSIPSFGMLGRSYAAELWFLVRASPSTATTKNLIYLTSSTETQRLYINYSTAPGFTLTYQHGAFLASFPISIVTETWHHVVMQRNYPVTQTEIYLDGVLMYTASDASWSTYNTSFSAGLNSSAIGVRFDEIALYGRILSQGEINQRLSARSAALTTPTPTITYTPSITPTPTDTPTPTSTPTATPGYDYAVVLPGGGEGRIAMEVTAGEIMNGVLAFMIVALLIGVLYALLRKQGSA